MDNPPHKDVSLARSHRDRGNTLFEQGQYKRAAFEYTQAIRLAPCSDSILGIALSNKAQCLMRLQQNVPEALELFEHAVSAHYPSDKLNKLMSNIDACKAALRGKDVRPPAIVRGLSPKVAVTDTQGLGRSVVATTGIAAGEVILVQEKPFCAALFAEHATRCCHNCFSNVTLTLSLPCTSCTQVIFCSATCRDEVSIWHTDICGKSLTGLSDELRLALFSLLKQAAQSVLLEEGEFLNSLVDHESDAPLELIAELNNDISELFLLVDPHLELRISRAQLLKRALQIHTNSYATFRVERDDDGVMMEENPTTKLETQVQRRLGLAVYALGSMFNHSCQPNAVVSYADGNELVIRALRVITKGEHVYHSYGPLATKEPRVKRRDILRSKFFFECNCAACVPQDAEHAEEPLGSLLEEELQWESDDILDQLERTTSFAQFRELATRAEAILAKWEASDSPISSNVGWVKAGELADRLAHHFAMLKDYESSIALCERSIKFLHRVHAAGCRSIEMGREYLKLATLYFEVLVQAHNQADTAHSSSDVDVAAYVAMRKRLLEVIDDATLNLEVGGADTAQDISELKEMKDIVMSLPS